MEMATFLRWMILGPLFIPIVVLGYIYNVVCLVTLLRNGVPLSQKLFLALTIPFGVSLWAALVVAWGIIYWIRDFYSARGYAGVVGGK